jgi:amino acid adenylation domain-containing protein
MTLLTAFDVLLSRHTGQEDIVVGSTIAGRGRAELDGLIGFFINAVALRADLSGNPTFLDLLKRVREVCLDAYTHQDVPFERVVEEINPQRDLGHNPIFQVMFNMADISERILSLYGCETAKIEGAYPGSKFDLVLHAPETDKKLGLTMAYNADLFGESRIAVLLEQFRYLLLQVVESPQKTLDQYSLVTPSAGVLLPDATEPLDDSWEGSIQQRISQQADRMSHRLAVVDAHESWTYQELDTRGNQLANHLRASGIQPGEVVAIYAHRSAPLVLALLGVLKAGAVFLILDPDYPASRLIQYLRIARPKGWLQMRAAGELPEEVTRCLDTLNLRCRVLLPRSSEEINELLRGRSKAERAVVVHADDPAYIAFTSGSTGQPKGVLCRHGPITHFLPWQEKTFNLRSTDRFCLLSGLAYNYLQRDVFTALWLGSTVYVPAPERLQSPDQLGAWLRQHEITVLHLTPASGHWLRTSSDQKFPLIRRIFLGGDALTRRELMMMHEIAPNATFVNLYGATETQRASSYWIIDDEFLHPRDHAKENVPVGHGAKDVQLLLLTPGGQLAGIGELGELYVRSPHLAAGYIGDEELTREKFLSNPFAKTPSDRVYRTGEFGRYLPNGDVEWAGRKDRRINIRGFRLELEEVETVLKQHPTVRDAAVIAWGYEEHPSDNPKSKTRTEQSRNIANPDKRLVAYLVSDEVGQSLIDLLRSFLSSKFPGYMVPSDFIIIDRLPLSPNGKVDYPSLLPPDQFLRRDEVNFAAPRTELERELGKILSEILGKERIGREDNFFHLGGHSLSAAQASARIRERFGVALDLRLFFDSPTIAELAQKLELLIGEGKAAEAFRGDEREEIEL